jgi:hypothetical protein
MEALRRHAMIRAARTWLRLAEGTGTAPVRHWPGSGAPQTAKGDICHVLAAFPGVRLLAPAGALWQEPAACRGFWADSVIPGMLP